MVSVGGSNSTVSAGDRLEMARAVVGVLSGASDETAVLATVIGRAGSAPQVVGARMMLRADGSLVGTVGGGAIEAQVLDACRETLADGRTRRIEAHLVRDLGMCCGGSMEVLVERLEAVPRLVLVGDGRVARALAPVAHEIGFRVLVVADDASAAAAPAFAEADSVHVASGPDGLAWLEDPALRPGPRDFVVVAMHNHRRDEALVSALLTLDRPVRYLGWVASRSRVQGLLDRAEGPPPPGQRSLHAPVGLAIGARSPAEIAVSVAAELVAARRGGTGVVMNVVPDALERAAVAG